MLFDGIALGSQIFADLFVVVIFEIVRSGKVLVVMSDLMYQNPFEDFAVFVERFVAVNAHDTAVIDLDRLAEVIAHIHAQYVEIVILGIPVVAIAVLEDNAAVELAVKLGGKRIGDLIEDRAAFFVCHGSVQKVLELL